MLDRQRLVLNSNVSKMPHNLCEFFFGFSDCLDDGENVFSFPSLDRPSPTPTESKIAFVYLEMITEQFLVE